MADDVLPAATCNNGAFLVFKITDVFLLWPILKGCENDEGLASPEKKELKRGTEYETEDGIGSFDEFS